MILTIAKMAFQALRWQAVSRSQGVRRSVGFFVRCVFQVKALEYLVPVPNSEDVVRLAQLKLAKIPTLKSVSIIFADRIVGLTILVSFLMLSVNVMPLIPDDLGLGISFGVLLCVLLMFICSKHLSAFAQTVLSKLHQKLRNVITLSEEEPAVSSDSVSMSSFFSVPSAVFGFSQVLSEALILYSLFKAFGLNLTVIESAGLVPLCTLSLVMPLSYHGIGLYEGALVVLLMILNFSELTSITVAMAHFQLTLITLLMGVIAVIMSGRNLPVSLKQHV